MSRVFYETRKVKFKNISRRNPVISLFQGFSKNHILFKSNSRNSKNSRSAGPPRKTGNIRQEKREKKKKANLDPSFDIYCDVP